MHLLAQNGAPGLWLVNACKCTRWQRCALNSCINSCAVAHLCLQTGELAHTVSAVLWLAAKLSQEPWTSIPTSKSVGNKAQQSGSCASTVKQASGAAWMKKRS